MCADGGQHVISRTETEAHDPKLNLELREPSRLLLVFFFFRVGAAGGGVARACVHACTG